MYKFSYFTFLFIVVFSSYSQAQLPTPSKKDSLINELCISLKGNEELADTSRIFIIYEDFFKPFLVKYPNDKRELIATSLYYRAQRICPDFKFLLDRLSPPNEYRSIEKMPKQIIKSNECKTFRKITDFYYTEQNGDTVNLKITDDYWVDNFKNGTYSKLSIDWVSNCQFTITFIESNNELRSNFSYPGDEYNYTLIEKTKNYFEVVIEVVGTGQKELFKLFYK